MSSREGLDDLPKKKGNSPSCTTQVFGSHILWNDLLANDLIDELHLMIGNFILGAGTPIFNAQPTVSLHLMGVRRWDDADNVVVQYEVRRKSV